MKKISTYHDIQLRITQKAHYGILISIVPPGNRTKLDLSVRK